MELEIIIKRMVGECRSSVTDSRSTWCLEIPPIVKYKLPKLKWIASQSNDDDL